MGAWIVVVIVVIAVIAVGLVLGAISAYNRMVKGRNLVEQSWNQIDVELKRRYDLIPNLVNTIKGAVGHEQQTLELVIGLRNQAAGLAGGTASLAQRSQIEEQLSSQLQNLVSVTMEAYPDLKANAAFMNLMNELREIETRIANSRKYYNANVGNYNTLIESFPNSLMAGMGHFARADYFQIQDPGARQNPVVDFAGTAAAPETPLAITGTTEAPFALPTPAPAAEAEYEQPDFARKSGRSDH